MPSPIRWEQGQQMHMHTYWEIKGILNFSGLRSPIVVINLTVDQFLLCKIWQEPLGEGFFDVGFSILAWGREENWCSCLLEKMNGEERGKEALPLLPLGEDEWWGEGKRDVGLLFQKITCFCEKEPPLLKKTNGEERGKEIWVCCFKK